MKFIDIFSGIGTIRMGMEKAQHECIYSIENNHERRKIYSILFGKEPEGGDILDVKQEDIPKADCWCFGFPCKDFSRAGNGKGFDGDSGQLFFAVTDLIKQLSQWRRPKYLLIENVKRFKTHDDGFTFLEAQVELARCGYDTEWQIIKSRKYVAQDRERMFIIGHKGGNFKGNIFPIVKETESQPQLSSFLDVNVKDKYIVKGELGKKVVEEIKKENKKDKFTNDGTQIQAVVTPKREKKRQSRRSKLPGEPSYCLTELDRHGVYDGKIVRVFTPKECWRLQGIPEEYINKVNHSDIDDEAMYKGAGLGCTVPIIEIIAKRLKQLEEL